MASDVSVEVLDESGADAACASVNGVSTITSRTSLAMAAIRRGCNLPESVKE